MEPEQSGNPALAPYVKAGRPIMHALGRGGASHVYLAQGWHALQEVVLKFPDDDVIGGAAAFERYKREAEIGRRLSHPYIQRHLLL